MDEATFVKDQAMPRFRIDARVVIDEPIVRHVDRSAEERRAAPETFADLVLGDAVTALIDSIPDARHRDVRDLDAIVHHPHFEAERLRLPYQKDLGRVREDSFRYEVETVMEMLRGARSSDLGGLLGGSGRRIAQFLTLDDVGVDERATEERRDDIRV